MKIPTYYVVELIVDVNNSWNSRVYNKGERVMVWEDDNIGCYGVSNTNDNFKFNCAKKIYEFKCNLVELEDDEDDYGIFSKYIEEIKKGYK